MKKTERNLISVRFGWRFDFWTSNMTEWLSDKNFTTSWIVSTIGRKQINMNKNDKFNVEKNKMENGKRIMGTGKKAEEWLVGLTSRQRNERMKMEKNTIWNMWHRKYVWFAFHWITYVMFTDVDNPSKGHKINIFRQQRLSSIFGAENTYKWKRTTKCDVLQYSIERWLSLCSIFTFGMQFIYTLNMNIFPVDFKTLFRWFESNG